MGENPARVKGIGGIFFYSEDPEETKQWYADHLGIDSDKYGHIFISRGEDSPDQKQILQWSPMASSSKYFSPSTSEFMINYRVENLKDLLHQLNARGITIIGEIQEFEYGKFAWIQDNEGRKIELWEPIDGPLLSSSDNG